MKKKNILTKNLINDAWVTPTAEHMLNITISYKTSLKNAYELYL